MKKTRRYTFVIFLATTFSMLSAQSIQRVSGLTPGPASTFDEEGEEILAAIGSRAVFRAKTSAGNWAIWASDGTAAGTQVLQDFGSEATFGPQAAFLDGLAFIVGRGRNEIWYTDGTIAGTSQLNDFAATPRAMKALGEALYISTSEGTSSSRLIRYNYQDGSLGTVFTFPSRGGILDMEVLDESTLVLLAGSDDGRALYRSDGTAAGTEPYYVVNTGSEFSQATLMAKVDDRAFFFYRFPGSDGGYFLYVTDGTAAGTRQLGEFEFNNFTSSYRAQRSIFSWNGKFFFRARELGAAGNQDRLFVSDGTAAGTFPLDPDPSEFLRPAWMTPYNGQLYFMGDFCCFTFGVFRTDGSQEGTEEVLTGDGLGGGGSFGGDGLLVYQGELYFLGYRNETGGELWRSDGTVAGTSVLELVPGEGDSNPYNLTVADSLLFFIAETPQSGKELFVLGKSNCTTVTTDLSASICQGEDFLGFTEPGTYQALLFTEEGCDSIVNLDLQVWPLPEVSLGPDTVIALGESLLLSVGDGFESQQWSDGSTGADFLFVAADYGLGDFPIAVEVVDENGCARTEQINITVVMGSASGEADNGAVRFSLAPNPLRAGQPVRLFFTGDAPASAALQVQLYSADGRKVVARQLGKGVIGRNELIVAENLAPGFYLLRLLVDGKAAFTQPLFVF